MHKHKQILLTSSGAQNQSKSFIHPEGDVSVPHLIISGVNSDILQVFGPSFTSLGSNYVRPSLAVCRGVGLDEVHS